METMYISTSLDGLLDEDLDPDLIPELGKDRLTIYFDTTFGFYTPKGNEILSKKYY